MCIKDIKLNMLLVLHKGHIMHYYLSVPVSKLNPHCIIPPSTMSQPVRKPKKC